MKLLREALHVINASGPFSLNLIHGNLYTKVVDDLVHHLVLPSVAPTYFAHCRLRATIPLHYRCQRGITSSITMSRRISRQAVKAAVSSETKESGIGSNGNTESTSPVSKPKVIKRKATKAVVEEEQETAVTEEEAKPTKKRRTTKNKVEDTTPLAERTVVSSLKKSMYIGAHVSSAGGELLLSFGLCKLLG